MFKKLKIPPMTSVFKLLFDPMGFPVHFGIHPHCQRNQDYHLLYLVRLSLLQCLQVLFCYPGTFLINLVPADQDNEQWAAVSGLNSPGSLSAGLGPREVADFPVGWVWLADRVLHSPQK